MPETSFTNSPDLIKKEITQLAQIFPQFVSEGKVDFEGLQQYLQNEKAEKERYTMNRHGKSQAKLIAREPSKATLRPHKEKSKERDTTKNLLIEGDNLEVLKLLQNGYYEKVKCIYIDPPYNKDKDFVYTDTRKDPVENYLRITGQRDDEGETSTEIETTGRKHSNWLSMMYPRLYLARKLLRDDGVIFVSIDDDEVANLRKLMDEIFGEENFLYQLSVVNKLNGNDNSSGMMETQEYALMYTKNINDFEVGVLPIDEDTSDWQEDELGFWKEGGGIKATGVAARKEDRPNLHFPLYINETTLKFSLERSDEFSYELFPKIDGYDGRWTWGKEKFKQDANEVIIKQVRDGYSVYKKQRPQLGDLPSKRGKTTFYNPSYSTANSSAEIKALFDGKKLFDFSKSSYLIKDLISLANTNRDSTILDFFAGSGTTAQAVMQLNAEDGGNRQFILVQLPEKIQEDKEAYKAGYRTISDITRARILKAGEKIASGDTGFRYLSLDTSNFSDLAPIELKEGETHKDTLISRLDIEYDGFGIKRARTDDDIIYELLVRYGYALDSQITKSTEFPNRYLIDNQLLLSLQDSIPSEEIENFVKAYHNKPDTLFVCKDEAISEGDRLTLANVFPGFTTL